MRPRDIFWHAAQSMGYVAVGMVASVLVLAVFGGEAR